MKKNLKILVILQACLSFTLIFYYFSYPFTGKLYEQKKHLKLYSYLIKDKHFPNIPYETQQEIEKAYRSLKEKMHPPFTQKLTHAFRILFFDLPPFLSAYLFFSLVISILLLLRVQGAKQAIFIIPLLVFFLMVDQYLSSKKQKDQLSFFPSEQQILTFVPNLQPSKNPFKIRKQLEEGWHNYLIMEWAKEKPAKDKNIYTEQLQKGKFYFHLAQSKFLLKSTNTPPHKQPKSLFFYFFLAFPSIIMLLL